MFFVISKRKAIFSFIIIILLIFAIIFPFTQAESADNKMPIIMYHNVSKKSNMLGLYVTSVNQLEKDMIYIKDNGYTTILMKDIIDFAKNGTPLPAKPIMLTFDDGHECCLTYLVPLLEKYDMKAVVSVVGSFSDLSEKEHCPVPEYCYLTWDEIKELSDNPRVEIQNHTYTLHSNATRQGCKIKNGESFENYKKVLSDDLSMLQDKIFEFTGRRPDTFTYPFGHLCKESVEILEELGFEAALTCSETQVDLDNINLFRLGRFNRPHGKSSETFFKFVLSH